MKSEERGWVFDEDQTTGVVVGCDFTDEVHEVTVIRHGTMQVDVRPVAPPQDAFWRMLNETARERHDIAERSAEL